MKTSSTRTRSSIAVVELIEDARNAELCRNLELSQSIFAPIWDDISQDPDLDHFEPKTRADLYRLCGFFLSFYGYSKSLPDFQLRGKDLLTQSIELFDIVDLPDSSAEAQVMLALCYWYSGEIEESEAILSSIEQTFQGNELHPVYLQIKVNRLMAMYWKGQFQPGIEIIEQITTPMEFCRDVRLKTIFHNQAGILFNVLSQYETAIHHLSEAIRFAKRSNNKRFIALNLNNLAFSNKQLGRFDAAHDVLDRAEEIIRETGDFGWLPHMLDTRALIFIDQRKPIEALIQAERSIDLFSRGEDFAGLVDSLWTKCRCLIRLDRLSEALINFAELKDLAAMRIGDSAVTKYADLFASETYCIKDSGLSESVNEFKKFLILKAMRQANSGIVEASKILGLKNHQALSEMLNKQFPEIYEELGIRRRSRRQDAKSERPAAKKISLRDISRIRNSAASRTGMQGVETFYFSAKIMAEFGVSEESIVAVSKAGSMDAGLHIVYSIDNDLFLGKVQRDQFSGLFFVKIDGREALLDELQIIGTPTGYCRLSQADKDEPDFEALAN